MLSNISDLTNNSDLLHLFTAVTIVDLIIIFISKSTGVFGKNLDIWYNKFNLSAVILDIFIIVIGAREKRQIIIED